MADISHHCPGRWHDRPERIWRASYAGFGEKTQFGSTDPGPASRLRGAGRESPGCIAVDLNSPPSDLDLTLLRARPDLLLVGVNPSSDEVLVLSGQLTRVLSGRELAGLVSEHGTHSKTMNELKVIVKGGDVEHNSSDVDKAG